MAIGNITGKTNIPVKLYEYTGKNTPTAETIIDNNKKEISVNVNVEEVTKDCASKEDIAKSVIKSGSYILNDENNFINVEEIPSDYTGISFTICDDGTMYLEMFIDGEADESLELAPSGTSKIQPSALVGLTHSLSELDPTLKAIIDTAIDTHQPVDCTEEEWNTIKRLLDNSLYLNYNGYTLIKVCNDVYFYAFGFSFQKDEVESSLRILFDAINTKLNCFYNEV